MAIIGATAAGKERSQDDRRGIDRRTVAPGSGPAGYFPGEVSVASAGLPARPNGLAKTARHEQMNSTSARQMPHEKFLWIAQNQVSRRDTSPLLVTRPVRTSDRIV